MRYPTGLLLFVISLFIGCATAPRADRHAFRRYADGLYPAMLTRGAVCPISTPAHIPLQANLEHQLNEIAKRALSSIVRVRAAVAPQGTSDGVSGAATATSTRYGGTGIVIDADGLILTNEHVVRNAGEITVILPDGSTRKVTRVVVADHVDLAILRVRPCGIQPLPLSIGPRDCGLPVVAVSAPGRDRPAAHRSGVITNPVVSLQNELDASQRRHYDDLIESTAYLSAGFSGGPLLDDAGRLVGINVAAYGDGDDPHARGYAIPFSRRTRAVLSALVQQAGGSP